YDVQLSGQPEPVLRAGIGRRTPLEKGKEGDRDAPRHGAMGHVLAQPRRTRSRPTERTAATAGLCGLRPGSRDAALRARYSPAARADGGWRSSAVGAGLQLDVHAAR